MTVLQNRRSLLPSLVLLVLQQFCPLTRAQTQQPATVIDAISSNLRFSTLVTALTSAHLIAPLSDVVDDSEDDEEAQIVWTLFAPTNAAFHDNDASLNLTRLLQPPWKPQLRDLLQYHVLFDEERTLASFTVDEELTALQEEVITVTSIAATQQNTRVELNNEAMILRGDFETGNGLVHVLDNVLLPQSVTHSIFDYAQMNPELSTAVEMLERVGLATPLSTRRGPWTVFLPNNSAFDNIPDEDYVALLADDQWMRQTLLNHVVRGNLLTQDLMDDEDGIINTFLAGSNITIGEDGGDQVWLDDVALIGIANVVLNNGIVHTIDNVLLPPPPDESAVQEPTDTLAEVADENGLAVFYNAAERTGVLEELLNDPIQSLTVFGPVNSAFYPTYSTFINSDEYYLHLRRALEYHILQDQVLLEEDLVPQVQLDTLLPEQSIVVTEDDEFDSVLLNDVTQIVIPDLLASNGVLHVIDSVLVRDFAQYTVLEMLARQPFGEDYTTLIYLLLSTGLVDELEEDTTSSLTIFAPNNAAFAALLAQPEFSNAVSDEDVVKEILQYHIVPQVVYVEDLMTSDETIFETLQGNSIFITTSSADPITEAGTEEEEEDDEGEFWLDRRRLRRHLQASGQPRSITVSGTNSAMLQVDQSNRFGNNGVIHTIDSVLIPPLQNDLMDPPPTVAPTEPEEIEQVCYQWGSFDEVCCPVDSTSDESDSTTISRQGEAFCGLLR